MNLRIQKLTLILRCIIGVTSLFGYVLNADECPASQKEFCGNDVQNPVDDLEKLGLIKNGVFDVYKNMFFDFEDKDLDDCKKECPDPTSRNCKLTCKQQFDEDGYRKAKVARQHDRDKAKNSLRKKKKNRPKRSRDEESFGGTYFQEFRCDDSVWPCCTTCRKSVPIVYPFEIDDGILFPVFCPYQGGYQVYDYVYCVPKGCSANCTMQQTLQNILVTNEPPDGWRGHCSKTWIKAWFVTHKVNSHCTCPGPGDAKPDYSKFYDKK